MTTLKPLNLSEDIEKYEARSETVEVNLKRCKHENVKFESGILRCPCGAAWSGPRLDELYRLLSK